MSKEKFKVLLVYANSFMDTLIPVSITCLATALRSSGVDVKLFDTTFYKGESSDFIRLETGQVRDFTKDERKFPVYITSVENDFRKFVIEYAPDIIGVSCVETTYLLALRLINSVADINVKVIVGGIHAIFSPEDVINEPNIDMVCIGEGEMALVELCRRMAENRNYKDIKNIWVKENGRIYKNERGYLDYFETATFEEPNYDMYETARFFRPMSGKVYRMFPLEFSRGCPYKCTYCSAPGLDKLFKGHGKWFRYKDLFHIRREIDTCVNKYKAEYFYFVSETFLAMPKKRFDKFIEMYSDFKIPFWFNTRPETITEEKVRKLEAIGCHRVSIGVEHGNEEFRRRMLQRNVSNKKIIEACKIMENSSIEFSVNNIIGFPETTRELIFDTINLNREFWADNHTALIFQPFRGTWLYDYCIKNGYYLPGQIAKDDSFEPVIKYAKITPEEIKGLHRTFNLYIRFPKSEWARIRIAEQFTDEGNRIYEELMKEYRGKYTRKHSKVNQA